jgi:hypothetical protein
MGSQKKGRFWRICRVYFRRFRISVWLLVLTLLAAVVYLNQVGLPDLVKRPLLRKLKERGVDLQFSRLRLSWYEGIVAENVRFGPADQQFSPHLKVADVEVRLNWAALRHLQVQIDSLMLRQGRVTWAFSDTNPAVRELSVTNIQTDLRFLPDDQWVLDNFRAQVAGATLQLSGMVTNASAVRDWKIFQGQQPASRSAKLWEARLRSIANTLNDIHFSAPPELRVNVRGDALDLRTFSMLLSVSAPGAQTPWGTIVDGRFAARLFSVDSNGLSRAELDLRATAAETAWGSITNASLSVNLASAEGQTNEVKGQLKLTAAQAHTPWAEGSNALFTATWIHSITNLIPLSGQGTLACDFVKTPWASATEIQLNGQLAPAVDSGAVETRDPSWAWWTNLQPYRLSWDCRFADLKSPKLTASRIACAGDWQPPTLIMTNLQAAVWGGQLGARGQVDVATRAASLNLDCACDVHQLAPFLPDDAQSWLANFSWPSLPALRADLSLTLPAWTNLQANVREEVLPSVRVQGEVNLPGGAAFRNVQVSSVRSHFVYSNQCWFLPDFVLARPEGRLELEQRFDERTQDFYTRLSSNIDPSFVRPLLSEPTQRAFDLLVFSNPPAVTLEIRGRAQDPATITAAGGISASNLTFRGESFSAVRAEVHYTNHVIRFLAPRVDIGNRYVQAEGLALDLDSQFVFLTNGFSTVEPMVIARAIGSHVARDIQDYQFGVPPTARVHGSIPLRGEEGADLHFDLAGGPFHWWKFNVPHITGHVHWFGLHLTLTNVQAEFYHGVAFGDAAFDFPRDQPTDFRFALTGTNVLLQSLMHDLSPATNQPEGRFSASLQVTKANSENWQSVFGFGEAHLRDGLLWDFPIFGVFSPILNGITPGLGNSRASAATASFVITNGVIRTSDLEIRSTGMRIQYRGTVNLESQLNARVDAELLRDMWLVGPLVSTVFWPVTKLFEYKVSGTLGEPRTDPVFMIPKILLMPFHPLKTLKGLKEENPNSNPNFSPLPP